MQTRLDLTRFERQPCFSFNNNFTVLTSRQDKMDDELDNAYVPVLPEDAKLVFVAEGAANIVYKIILPPGTPQESLLDDYEDGTPQPTEIDPSALWREPFQSKLTVGIPVVLPLLSLSSHHLSSQLSDRVRRQAASAPQGPSYNRSVPSSSGSLA